MYMPAWANVLGVQMSLKVPPPPSVIHKLQYCESQRRFGSESAVRLPLYGFNREPSAPNAPWPPMKRTSFINEFAPAIHLAATARGLIPPASRPMPVTMLEPPGGVSSSGLGGPTPWKPGVE